MITSAQNTRIKLVRSLLAQGKTREQEQQVVLEGTRLVRDVFSQGYTPAFVLYKEGFQNALLDDLMQQQVECLSVEPRIFEALSETEHSQGLLAVFPLPRKSIPPTATLLLALDAIRDPGNAGTILRTAAAAGVEGVLLLPGTVDLFNPKVIRAGMGAHFRLPLLPVDWQVFARQYANWSVVAADANPPTAIPYHQADWQPPTILIVGNEAHGISQTAHQYTRQSVYIPMAAGVESLNASIAAAVILFEIRRSRGTF